MDRDAIESRLNLANTIARDSGEVIRSYFQTDQFTVQHKADGSPLTIADQETEKFLRGKIRAAFPDDAIVGEEYDDIDGKSGFRWIVDPIDGTKSFICGVPLFGTMVGIEFEGRSIIGSVYFPGLDEGIYASAGNGAWHFRGDNTPALARVSSNQSIADAVLVTTAVETFGERAAADVFSQLSNSVRFTRTWGDVYGYMLVATGRVDVMIDPILNIWDAAAVQPIIEEAGGRFTDWKGDARIDAGEAIGTNGGIHDQVLEITRPYAGTFK